MEKKTKNIYEEMDGTTLVNYREYLYMLRNDIATRLMYINQELEKRTMQIIHEEPIPEEKKPTDEYIRIKRKEWDL